MNDTSRKDQIMKCQINILIRKKYNVEQNILIVAVGITSVLVCQLITKYLFHEVSDKCRFSNN